MWLSIQYIFTFYVTCSWWVGAITDVREENIFAGFKNVDPEIYMNADQMITSKGYPCENHNVTTEDGYILTLQRIPYGRNQQLSAGKPAVILQHGLIGESTNYLDNLANESLAYILADAGADVWLSNSRGNSYSRAHIHYNPSEKAFWDFSFDEMARYDLPAVVNYVLGETGQEKLTYVGHSQGSMIGFAGFSENQTLGDQIELFVALAPIAKVGHIKSPLHLLAPFAYEIDFLIKYIGSGQFLPSTNFSKLMAKDVCTHASELCESIFFLVNGFDYKNMNKTRVPVYIAHNPSGTSAKNIIHFAQAVKTDTFQKYDYMTAEENRKYYGQPRPPSYHPEEMKTPVMIFRGGADWLADPQDVFWLLPKLQHIVHDQFIDYYEHLDFVYGMDARHVIYQQIIENIFRKSVIR